MVIPHEPPAPPLNAYIHLPATPEVLLIHERERCEKIVNALLGALEEATKQAADSAASASDSERRCAGIISQRAGLIRRMLELARRPYDATAGGYANYYDIQHAILQAIHDEH